MLRHLLLIALLLAAPLFAQESLFIQVPNPTNPKDRTKVELTALFSMPSPSGYLPIRVTTINQRKNDAKLRFLCSSTSGSGGEDNALESEFSLLAKAGATSINDLLVPLTTQLDSSGYGGNSISIRMSGSLGSNYGNLSADFTSGGPAILMSEKLHTASASALDAELSSRPGGYGSQSFAARFEPSAMPEDWRAYSGYDILILSDDDWHQVVPGARNAILQWCRLGGQLAIYCIRESTHFASLGIETEQSADFASYGYGQIGLHKAPTGLRLNPGATLTRYYGTPFLKPLDSSILNDYSNYWPLHHKFGSQKFSYALFIVVLIGFGILVGPVNLFVFAKSGQRHKLFITTPIISLATSALLILLILIKDGVGGHGERIALIEVRPDSGENNAYVLQEQISRTGVLIGSTFSLHEDATISPVPIADNNAWARLTPQTGGAGARYTANFEDAKLALSGDWFQSRSEQGQLIRAVVPTRGRIELKSQTGQPTLLSTFDFEIDTLYYIDHNSGFWVAHKLKSGTSITCNPITEADYQSAIADQASKLGDRHRQCLDSATQRPGHYIAITDQAPALESFDSIRWQSTHTILTGPALR